MGSMGDVFKAEHRRLKRTVAIKVLSAALIKSPEDVERFRREVEAAGKLDHPNIITTYDADEACGAHFLVMQHVSGVDLEVLVRVMGPLTVADATHCILQAARGLAHAHGCGVVHRDIKPGNMMLGADGVLRILDMGLACMAPLPGSNRERGSTEFSIPMGTPGFHAPEQARLNAPPDIRSDLCSLGYTLHYLLTGKTAHESESRTSGHPPDGIQTQYSLRRGRPEIPESLDLVYQKLTAPSPNHRYQAADDLISDLEESVRPSEKELDQLRQSVIEIMEAEEHSRVPGNGEPLSIVDAKWSILDRAHPTVPLPCLSPT